MDLRAPLASIVETERFFQLDMLDRYYRDQQDSDKRYDWDGAFISGGMGPYSPMAPNYYVPYSARRPSTRYRLAYVVVSLLTEMAIADCTINVEGDEKAEAAARAYATQARLFQQMAEVRSLGGAMGTGCASLGIVDGRFRVDVHNPKHCHVGEWRDRTELIPAEVIKAYRYQQDVWDPDAGKNVARTFWYVRIWTDQTETVWEAIPDKMAKTPNWSALPPDFEATHGFGFCPFYWAQNVPDSLEIDGCGDYEGSTDKLDEINRLASATTRGTQRNVDPTLVIRGEDEGDQIVKGSGGVIYSKGGADYLELKGLAINAAKEWLAELKAQVLDEAGAVMPSEEKLAGAAQSAAAMRILYRRMIAKCDVLRDQYGIMITRIANDMLRIAGDFKRNPISVQMPNGATERVRRVLTPDLDPGESQTVTLAWGSYFLPTAQDIKAGIDTAKAAAGGKNVLSQRSAVKHVADLLDIEDPDAELAEIEREAEAAAERMRDTFGEPGSLTPLAGQGDPEDDNGGAKKPPFEGGKPAPA